MQTTLPRFLVEGQAAFERLGIVFGELTDEVFQSVTLPDGWSVGPRNTHGEAIQWGIFDKDGAPRIKVSHNPNNPNWPAMAMLSVSIQPE
jgi:hypothetical protein